MKKKLGQVALIFVACILFWGANLIFVFTVFNFGLWLLPETWQPYLLLVFVALATGLPLVVFVFTAVGIFLGKVDIFR
jgi:hypothetical protein